MQSICVAHVHAYNNIMLCVIGNKNQTERVLSDSQNKTNTYM